MAFKASGSNRFRLWLLTSGLALWALVPVAVVVLLTISATTYSLHPRTAVFVSPEANTGEVSRPVTVELQWALGTQLFAPTWSGLVQENLAPAGTTLSNGTPIARIDGVLRIAAVTQVPLYRTLGLGASGNDVAELNGFLRSQQLAAPTSEKFTAQTLKAVKALASQLDVYDAAKVESFDPAWIVFLPNPGVVGETALKVGAPAPTPGTELSALNPALQAAGLVTAGSEKIDSSDDKPEKFIAPIAPSETALSGELLKVGDLEIPLAEDQQFVGAEALATLAGAADSKTRFVSGTLRLPPSADQWIVPAASIILDRSGVACVRVALGEDARTRPIRIATQANVDGRTTVIADLSDADRVAVFPPNEPATCK